MLFGGGEIIAGLASDWPFVTDSAAYPKYQKIEYSPCSPDYTRQSTLAGTPSKQLLEQVSMPTMLHMPLLTATIAFNTNT